MLYPMREAWLILHTNNQGKINCWASFRIICSERVSSIHLYISATLPAINQFTLSVRKKKD